MFFISIKKSRVNLGKKYTCTLCGNKDELHYNPMKEWNIDGILCGDCYSKKLHEYYPGDHIRVNKDLD